MDSTEMQLRIKGVVTDCVCRTTTSGHAQLEIKLAAPAQPSDGPAGAPQGWAAVSKVACKSCNKWQPESTHARMLQQGFATCSRLQVTWRFVSAESHCPHFVELPADQVEVRRTAATASVRQLKESQK